MKLICLTASLSSCAFNPAKLTPNFIDAKRNTCREYHVIQTTPTIQFAFSKEYPINHCDGFIALPPEQALDIKRHYEESIHQDSSGSAPTNFKSKIEFETKALSGVRFDPNAPITPLKVENDYDSRIEQEESSDNIDN